MKEDLKNKRLLIIVESPNKVKTISSILKKAGYSKAVVMASVGHISEIKNAKDSYHNTGIYPEKGFKMNLAVSDDKKAVISKLKEQADYADIVYLMTDPDREGSQIAWSLVKFLGLKKGEYVRAVTHEITPKAVVYAIEHPIPLEENLVEAAQSRMILDKMVGYALSPIAKNYIGARSVGRCQSAGLMLITDREKEIQAFKPEKYYDLFLNFEKNGMAFKAKYAGTDDAPVTRLPNATAVAKVKSECSGPYTVKDIAKKERKDSPKPPFSTATFQQEVSNRLGLSVKDAMSCAQKLFEGISVNGEHVGLITYHRTDSTEFAPEFIPTLKSYIEGSFGAGTYTAPRQAKKQDAEQDGHECLRCVDPSMTPAEAAKYLPNDLLIKVYKIIWQRTIASAMPDARISETTYGIYNGPHRFNLTSKELLYEGYKQVYSYKDDDQDDSGPTKETFAEGERLQGCELAEVLKQTQPPARYTEATFIKELQKRGIGRPSTFATIVETVLSQSRGYCVLDGKQMVPTDKGMQLSDFLRRSFSSVISIDYTKEMEKDLDLIADGRLKKTDFLETFYNGLESAIKGNNEFAPISATDKVCPKCGAPMVVRRSRFGKLFYGCSNYPDCNGIVNIDGK